MRTLDLQRDQALDTEFHKESRDILDLDQQSSAIYRLASPERQSY